tara:strand:- start:333 stop:803 length:471 start_codon:yes stop_codon:yes gene_type:complete
MVIFGFNGNLNSSVSIGDLVYTVETTTVGSNTDNSTEFTVGSWTEPTSGFPIVVGTITSIQTNDINSSYYTTMPLSVTVIDDEDVETVTAVNTVIEVQELNPIPTPTATSFVFFSKNNKHNMSSLTGYYGEVEFRNNSKTKAELFATACEIEESSK